MDIETEQTNGAAAVRFSGEATINDAAGARAAIAEAFRTGAAVVLDVERMSAAHLSFLQLVCSAHRTALKHKKTLTARGLDRGGLSDAARSAGLPRTTGCSVETLSSCPWAVPGANEKDEHGRCR